MKKLSFILQGKDLHWVGDGFPVRNIFSYNDTWKNTKITDIFSPFLLIDYAGPMIFPASENKLGVGPHPHRGFETVTIVFHGEVEHRDSTGSKGIIGPGDVQWMTAAAGIVHEEFHGKDFARRGGTFEMVQLWINLSKKDKMSSPKYQTIYSHEIPQILLPNNAGNLRVIAGNYQGIKGVAETFGPVNLWDIWAKSGHQVRLKLPQGHSAGVCLLKGVLKLQEENKILEGPSLAVFDSQNCNLNLKAEEDSHFLFLGGRPMAEPIVANGPFVMNTAEEIQQAFEDFRQGNIAHRPRSWPPSEWRHEPHDLL